MHHVAAAKGHARAAFTTTSRQYTCSEATTRTQVNFRVPRLTPPWPVLQPRDCRTYSSTQQGAVVRGPYLTPGIQSPTVHWLYDGCLVTPRMHKKGAWRTPSRFVHHVARVDGHVGHRPLVLVGGQVLEGLDHFHACGPQQVRTQGKIRKEQHILCGSTHATTDVLATAQTNQHIGKRLLCCAIQGNCTTTREQHTSTRAAATGDTACWE